MVKSTSVKVTTGEFTLYATPTGIKTTARGRVEEPGAVLARLPKPQRRAARKAMYRAGLVSHAAARPVLA